MIIYGENFRWLQCNILYSMWYDMVLDMWNGISSRLYSITLVLNIFGFCFSLSLSDPRVLYNKNEFLTRLYARQSSWKRIFINRNGLVSSLGINNKICSCSSLLMENKSFLDCDKKTFLFDRCSSIWISSIQHD